MLYHSWTYDRVQVNPPGRVMLLDKINWSPDGWPYIEGPRQVANRTVHCMHDEAFIVVCQDVPVKEFVSLFPQTVFITDGQQLKDDSRGDSEI